MTGCVRTCALPAPQQTTFGDSPVERPISSFFLAGHLISHSHARSLKSRCPCDPSLPACFLVLATFGARQVAELRYLSFQEGRDMAKTVAYSPSEEKMMDSEQELEVQGVDPWRAAMQVQKITHVVRAMPTLVGDRTALVCGVVRHSGCLVPCIP